MQLEDLLPFFVSNSYSSINLHNFIPSSISFFLLFPFFLFVPLSLSFQFVLIRLLSSSLNPNFFCMEFDTGRKSERKKEREMRGKRRKKNSFPPKRSESTFYRIGFREETFFPSSFFSFFSSILPIFLPFLLIFLFYSSHFSPLSSHFSLLFFLFVPFHLLIFFTSFSPIISNLSSFSSHLQLVINVNECFLIQILCVHFLRHFLHTILFFLAFLFLPSLFDHFFSFSHFITFHSSAFYIFSLL